MTILEDEQPKTIVISCRLSLKEFNDFRKIQLELGLKESAMLRVAVKDYIKKCNYKKKVKPNV